MTLQLDSGLLCRHDSRTLRVLFFFPYCTKFLKFYCQPALAHLPLPPIAQANTRAKAKEPIYQRFNRSILKYSIRFPYLANPISIKTS